MVPASTQIEHKQGEVPAVFTRLHKLTQNPITLPSRDSTMLPTERAIYVARASLWSLITNRRLCPNFHHSLHKYLSIVGKGNRLQGVCVVASHDGSDVIFLNIRSSEGVQWGGQTWISAHCDSLQRRISLRGYLSLEIVYFLGGYLKTPYQL
jgi:hypothetical protein